MGVLGRAWSSQETTASLPSLPFSVASLLASFQFRKDYEGLLGVGGESVFIIDREAMEVWTLDADSRANSST